MRFYFDLVDNLATRLFAADLAHGSKRRRLLVA